MPVARSRCWRLCKLVIFADLVCDVRVTAYDARVWPDTAPPLPSLSPRDVNQFVPGSSQL